MQISIRVLLAGTALGLAVSTYAANLAIPNREVFSQTGLLVAALLAHFILHHVRYLLGSQALSSERFRQQFVTEKTEHGISLLGGSVVYLFAIAAGASIARPRLYFGLTALFFIASIVYLMYQRQFLLAPSGRSTGAPGLTVEDVITKWSGFTVLEIVIAGTAWWLADPRGDQFWDTYGISGEFGFALALIAVVVVDVVSMRKLYIIDGKDRPYDATYDVESAEEFYNTIADDYRRAESENAEQLRQVVAELIHSERLSADAPLRVLDVGGGDGLVYNPFRSDPNVYWTCLDISERMLDRFRSRVMDERRVDLHRVDIRDRRRLIEIFADGEPYSVVLLSIALTSLSNTPDLELLGAQVADQGCLVIADIEPQYTMEDPYFKVKHNDRLIALETRPVDFSQVVGRLASLGFVIEYWNRIHRNGNPYGFALQLRREATSSG